MLRDRGLNSHLGWSKCRIRQLHFSLAWKQCCPRSRDLIILAGFIFQSLGRKYDRDHSNLEPRWPNSFLAFELLSQVLRRSRYRWEKEGYILWWFGSWYSKEASLTWPPYLRVMSGDLKSRETWFHLHECVNSRPSTTSSKRLVTYPQGHRKVFDSLLVVVIFISNNFRHSWLSEHWRAFFTQLLPGVVGICNHLVVRWRSCSRRRSSSHQGCTSLLQFNSNISNTGLVFPAGCWVPAVCADVYSKVWRWHLFGLRKKAASKFIQHSDSRSGAAWVYSLIMLAMDILSRPTLRRIEFCIWPLIRLTLRPFCRIFLDDQFIGPLQSRSSKIAVEIGDCFLSIEKKTFDFRAGSVSVADPSLHGFHHVHGINNDGFPYLFPVVPSFPFPKI